MASKEREARLSPRTRAKLRLLTLAVESGTAQLTKDPQDRVQVVYNNEGTIPLSHVDESQVNMIQEGKDANDMKHRIHTCLEVIEYIKRTRAPSGVVIDPTKVGISASGRYTEGQQYTRLEEVLGKGECADEVVVIKDKKTGEEHAQKPVMILDFCSNEVRCWVDLNDSDHFPSLYLFQLVDNKVNYYMEKIEHGVELTDIISSHMANLRKKAPELVRPFSLCVFHGLLSAVGEMHAKNWAHCDLHGGNVMITKDTMELKVLDFEMAQRLQESGKFNHGALQGDIVSVIQLFCGVYIGDDFECWDNLEEEIKAGTLEKVLPETEHFNKAKRKELLRLIKMTYEVTVNPQLEGYRGTSVAMKSIEKSLSPDAKEDVMMQAAKFLFPEFYGAAEDIALRKEGEVEVTTGDSVPEGAAKEIPDDFQGLSIISEEDR